MGWLKVMLSQYTFVFGIRGAAQRGANKAFAFILGPQKF